MEPYIQKIQAAYPDLSIKEIRQLSSEGQFNEVLLVNETLVFRFARSQHGATDLHRETSVLKALTGKLPFAIPEPQYIGPGFMGYPMLPGEPLRRERFATITDEAVLQQVAADLAGFLKALHTIPPETLNIPFEPNGGRESWREWQQKFAQDLFPHMRRDAQEQITANFERAFADDSLWDFAFRLCHGDFGTGNILFGEGRITGIIDFAFCGPGDPAQDVGALIASYGDGFMERVFHFYPELRLHLPRAHFIMSHYALFQAYYALRDNNQADFEDGMQDYV